MAMDIPYDSVDLVYVLSMSYVLIGMLLVSRSGLVEENAVEVLHHYGVHLFSSFSM